MPVFWPVFDDLAWVIRFYINRTILVFLGMGGVAPPFVMEAVKGSSAYLGINRKISIGVSICYEKRIAQSFSCARACRNDQKRKRKFNSMVSIKSETIKRAAREQQMNSIRKLWAYTKPYKFFMMLAPLLMALEVTMDLLQPFMIQKIIDSGITNHDMSYVMKMGVLMAGAAIVGLACGIG